MTSVVLAGGGTAGHTSPLIATAKALEAKGVSDLVAVGTARGLEVRVIPEAGLDLALITPVPMPRTINLDLVKLPYKLTKSVLESRKLLKQRKADVVVGFGGYASIPVYLAAKLMRIPIVVHEANKLPGIANKIGAKWAKYIATTFDTPMGDAKVHQIGMPMARRITHPSLNVEEARAAFGLEANRPTLLVSGGSQGAVAINNALDAARDRILGDGIQILHVLGPKNFSSQHQVITHASGAQYRPVEFVSDMAQAYTAADLMVGRAGAGTVMETAVSGLPVIFVPLPWGNGEQGKNAKDLIDAEGGVLLEEARLSGDTLADEVCGIFAEDGKLALMSKAAKGMYPADADEVLADAVIRVAGLKEKR